MLAPQQIMRDPVAKPKGLNAAAAVIACLTCAGVAVPQESEAATIHVPADYSSIQQAINAAASGDAVVVSAGTYYETIDFLGKAITVTSEQGPSVTIIDGHDAGSVASFKSAETRDAVLSGFTLRGGFTMFVGGGIGIISASPTIRDNMIADNRVCSQGAGIYSFRGSPLIERNTITHNGIRGCSGSWGLGIFIFGGSAEIVNNLITENNDDGASVSGGGVALFAAGSATVRGNVISHNVISSGTHGCGYGGGIAVANNLQGTIVDNLIVGNKACVGSAIYWLGGGSTGSTAFVNNTVADNEGLFGAAAVYVAEVDGRNSIANNVIATQAGPAFFCQNTANASAPVFVANDMFRADGPASPYGGTCVDQTGFAGNISADPLFLGPAHGDYRVQMTSPIIDAGNDAAPQIPPVDLAGSPRIVDGNADGAAHVDMGALEYHNHAPVANAGADQIVIAGPNCTATVSLNGSGSDADGDALTYEWKSPAGGGAGPNLSLTLPVGSYVFTLTANDGNGGFATDSVVVVVVDTTPPTITALTATPSVIQQANHTMVPVVVSVAVTDCDSTASCRIVSVTSNEPEDGSGDGDTAPDWEMTGDLTLNVRAERAGNGTGRIYTITVACTDHSANTSMSTVTVTVPHGS